MKHSECYGIIKVRVVWYTRGRGKRPAGERRRSMVLMVAVDRSIIVSQEKLVCPVSVRRVWGSLLDIDNIQTTTMRAIAAILIGLNLALVRQIKCFPLQE